MGTDSINVQPEISERDLIERIKTGDKDAFREFYNQHVRLVYRYVVIRVNNSQDAEDLTTETFIRAWQALSSFQYRDTPVLAWLMRIAHNLVIDKYRKKHWLSLPLPWPHRDDENRFARVDDHDVIKRAFNTLSYDEQVILYLHYFEERTITEIAAVLRKSPNAVQVAEFRALRRLRKILKEA